MSPWLDVVLNDDLHLPVSRSIVTIPRFAPQETALEKIENLLEGIIDAISEGRELTIPFRTTRSPQAQQGDEPNCDLVRFPGRTIQEARRFEALFRIIELSHEALLSGNIITKRNIFYQNVDLFKSQGVVDDLVDNLAYTLGLGREDLNIVAAAKGLISGPVDLILRGGDVVHCNLPPGGILLPHIASVEKVDFHEAKWLLVVEKEATFKTLATSQYANNSFAGPGVIVTAKGFPDLATRRFLSVMHSARPHLRLYGLVDFDPHGIAIFRTYKSGSKRLAHEQDTTVPEMRWLGIRSSDVLSASRRDNLDISSGSDSQSSQDVSSQESVAYSHDGSQERHPSKRQKIRDSRDPVEFFLPLTDADRKKAVDLMNDIRSTDVVDGDNLEQLNELQRMLMLNVKAEIQAVDDFGNIASWLDERLCAL
ncbi:Spo11/DNA topoisomerase VI subunit A [Schizothecium vesticola]|uniref:DNA topoisomerase (ATP-hydrolyzing) n=1 Tax=Schizothecium vesticola TaxID=314040 RepID=A0AA40FBS2_9PEZI|nr:Spo11/DNA topoisomerase VI subunit A [Schizothecium vesticola]